MKQICTRNYNQDWSIYFKIDKTSPSGLIKIRNKLRETTTGCTVGNKTYYKSAGKGWSVSFEGSNYYVHRIIWVMTYGSIDSNLVIDHLDGNTFNNKIGNLSLKTPSGNSMNKKKYSKNTTGITGVKILKAPDGYNYYSAQWHELDGSRKYKLFSITKLGEELAKESARLYREEQIQRLILEGANYTERHGT